MAKPFDARELEARVEALLLRFQRSKDMTVVSSDGLTVIQQRSEPSPSTARGAASARRRSRRTSRWSMARQKPDRVVLVDLHLQFGQVATHLNLEVKQSLADVARDDAAMREPELLRTYATRHDSGLHVLAAPISPELAELVTAEHVGSDPRRRSSSRTTSVVIDAGSWLDERTMTVFEHAETVIFAVCPGDRRAQGAPRPARLPERGRLGRGEVDVRPEQPVRPRDPQAARRRERARDPGRLGAAVRPVPLPQGGQRGRPDRARRASLAARRTVREARGGGVRAGRHHVPERAGAQARGPIRGPHPPLTGGSGAVRSRGPRRGRSRRRRRPRASLPSGAGSRTRRASPRHRPRATPARSSSAG